MGDIRIPISSLIAPPFYAPWSALRSPGNSEMWMEGGRGSTKSSFISLAIISGIVRNPRAHGIVYRKIADTLRETVYSQLCWAIGMLGLGAYFQKRLAPLELEYLPTGQRVLFQGADKPEKSKGLKLVDGYFKYLWFEELTEFNGMPDIRTIKASVFRGSNEPTMTFYSYNPPISAHNWVNVEALVPRPGRYHHHSTYLDVPAEWLGEAFLAEAESLKILNPRVYRHMYLGEITGTGGQVFNNVQIIPAAPDWQSYPGVVGLDFGFATDPDALILASYDRRQDRVLIWDEFYGTGNSTAELSRQIKARVGRNLVTADSADPRMIAELQRDGINVTPAVKGPGSIEHGMRWLQSRAAICIDPVRCPNTAREFRGYEYPLDRHGQFLSTFPDRDNHSIDAVRYGFEMESRQGVRRSLLG